MDELKKNWGLVFIVGVVMLFVGGIISYIYLVPETESSDSVTNFTIAEAVAKVEAENNKTISDLKNEVSTLKEDLANLKNVTGTTISEGGEVVIISKEGYLLDEILLEAPYSKDLSDRELNIFDGKIDFDNDRYDAEEVFKISNLQILSNEKDFEGNAYLTIPEDGLVYVYSIESSLNTSTIDDDETLTLILLGKEVEISEWDNDEITFTQGPKYLIKESETITIDGKEVTLILVSNTDTVYITVDDEGTTIKEGRVKSISGLEIKVLSALSGSNLIPGQARLVIGEDVEVTISDRDEYEEDSIWEWQIDNNSIGLKLSEDFNEIDNDYNALIKKDVLCLPENYICISYNGLDSVDEEDYTFELEDGYVRVEGDFVNGIDDFSRIFINDTTGDIFDKDFNLIDNNDNKSIELSDSDSILNTISGKIVINDFSLNFGLSEVFVGNTNINSTDEDYLTPYGIFIVNPEDSAEDNFFEITVPEERLQGSVSVKIGTFA